ncbi:unnamed protein product [Menidia menidia]|uniref:Zinc finger protein 653 n=1 Tax=Menidia menidia TaxID=238744 RepID=A0A8S4B4D3_9TELE|nr:unnamed protein product [Menidia menidia]
MTCDQSSLLLALHLLLCAMGTASTFRGAGGFEKKTSILLREEPENPKCFAEGRNDFVCFWEEDEERAGSVDQYAFTYNYQNENSSTCPLRVLPAAGGKKLFVCHLNRIQMFVQMEADDKQLLQPAVDTMELGSNREMQRCLSSVRSKRNRRGPVIEADGMLKMFHCPYEGCSQVYVAISSFQNHVNLVHRKGRTKVCPHPGCGKKFYLSNHLHRHMIIHSGVRDFICETCGKSFKRKNHLEVHRRTHTGETPLQCEICGYQCRQRASLNWHMRKHTPEAHYNFTCDFCDKRFEKLDSVKFHKLKSHPEKQAT